MKTGLQILLWFSLGLSPLLAASPTHSLTCEDMASIAEAELCNQYKISLGDNVGVDLIPHSKKTDWQLNMSNQPKLVVKPGTTGKRSFIAIDDITPGNLRLDLNGTINSTDTRNSRLSIQRRNTPDHTQMILLLPKAENLTLDETPASDNSSEKINPWIIIAPATGFILHLGGWLATAVDIYDRYFFATIPDRVSGFSITLMISVIFTAGLSFIPHLIVRRYVNPVVPHRPTR